jgi:uncharacterized damage-inducible protein DinB
MRLASFSLAALLLAPAARAQQPAAAGAGPATLRQLWSGMTNYITTIAEEATEAEYGFRPVATVRTLGQLIAHVAGAQYMMCGAALGDPPRAEDEIERTKTTKADLIAALKASTAYCSKAYAQSDQDAAQMTQLFGGPVTRLYALGLNATHNGEHYGNLVTYLRIQGKVPPSSRRP